MKFLFTFLLVCTINFLFAQSPCIDTPFLVKKNYVTRILPCGGFPAASFGKSIALENNLLVVGDPNASDGGRVYIYRYQQATDNWNLVQTIQGLDTSPGDQFGFSIAILDRFIAVGAPAVTDSLSEEGAAYLFVNKSGVWKQRKKFKAPDLVEGAKFGESLDLDKRGIAIGAPGWRSIGTSSFVDEGIVYLYSLDSATAVNFRAKLRAPFGARGKNKMFGSILKVDNDELIVGCNGLGPVSLYNFIGGHWVLNKKIHYGFTNGTKCLGLDIKGGQAIFVNRRGYYNDLLMEIRDSDGGTWPLNTVIKPVGEPFGFDPFSTSVAIDRNLAIVGTPTSKEFGTLTGGLYLYGEEGGSWYPRFKYSPLNWPDALNFGYKVALSKGRIIASSEEGDGAVYIIDIEQADWCLPPYKHFVSSPMIGSVDLSWNDMSDATEYYSAVYDNEGERVSLINSSTANALHTGLIGGIYSFKVASVCGTKRGERIFGGGFVVSPLISDELSKIGEGFTTVTESSLTFRHPKLIEGPQSVSLVDINGRIIESREKLTDSKVEFSIINLPPAVYFVVLDLESELDVYKVIIN
ncbi:MAG: hypothetical protein ACI959_001997 [Limisphaerales bacterium]|jgi:hypothetical protein